MIKKIIMKKAKHTKGDWATAGKDAFKTDGGRWKLTIMRGDCAPLNNNIVAIAFGNTKEEAEANAERIVKANKMHDELIKYLDKAFKVVPPGDRFEFDKLRSEYNNLVKRTK